MKLIVRYLFHKNPVWVAPLILPIVLYGGDSVERAILFMVVIGIGLPTVHIVSFFVERWLPRMFRLFPVLIIAATVFTILEIVFVSPPENSAGTIDRLTLMIRAISVSGIVIVPTMRSPRGERFSERLQHVVGLTLGFLFGFAVFVTLRTGLDQLIGREIQPVAFGFFLLALGRIGYNLLHDSRGELVEEAE